MNKKMEECIVYNFQKNILVLLLIGLFFSQLDAQLDAILKDYPVKYVKIGMIPDVKSLKIISNHIKKYNLFTVLDPVSISSAGPRLSSEGLEQEIENNLFPLVKILTPNLSEARFYSKMELKKASENIIDELPC